MNGLYDARHIAAAATQTRRNADQGTECSVKRKIVVRRSRFRIQIQSQSQNENQNVKLHAASIRPEGGVPLSIFPRFQWSIRTCPALCCTAPACPSNAILAECKRKRKCKCECLRVRVPPSFSSSRILPFVSRNFKGQTHAYDPHPAGRA